MAKETIAEIRKRLGAKATEAKAKNDAKYSKELENQIVEGLVENQTAWVEFILLNPNENFNRIYNAIVANAKLISEKYGNGCFIPKKELNKLTWALINYVENDGESEDSDTLELI